MRRPTRHSRYVGFALCSAALISGCDSKKASQPTEAIAAAAASADVQRPDPGHSHSGHPPGPRRPAGPPALKLNAGVRAGLTTIRVTAHVGSVVIYKEGNAWVMHGPDGCTVPTKRVDRALDSLERLRAVTANEPEPEGATFQLQITLLNDEERKVNLDVAGRNDDGDLVRLENNSVVRVQGLDRDLWSPNPADWCREP